jgi:serine/threonine-protein kinase
MIPAVGGKEPSSEVQTLADKPNPRTTSPVPRSPPEQTAVLDSAQGPGGATSGSATSVAEAIDHATVKRTRGLFALAIIMSLGGIGGSFALGGDKLLRTVFCVAQSVNLVCVVAFLLLVRTREAMESRWTSAVWVVMGVTLFPAIAYFGVFSSVLMIPQLGLLFIAISRGQKTANLLLGIAVVAHLGVAIPIIAGWIPDAGLLPNTRLAPTQLAIVELLLITLLILGFGLGRWVRHTTREALYDLAEARRVIDDQKHALDEIKVDVARANRVNEGRWTGQTLGTWRLGLVLGRGGMGEVYEATSPEGRVAAVKLLAATPTETSGSLIERFYREMKLAAKLSSPHIVHVYEISERTARVPYIAMERLRGQDLAARLRTPLRMTFEDVLPMVGQVARGLDVAHAAGVVHRDLKPHNVFCHEGQWKILDFGVAKVIGSDGTLTDGAIVGTPTYMAPEQVAGSGVTHLADVYALGAIAYRCVTGRSPFSATDVASVLYQVVHVAPPRPRLQPSVPKHVSDVLAIAMAKDPRARFQSALEFVEHLDIAVRGGTLSRPVPLNAWS